MNDRSHCAARARSAQLSALRLVEIVGDRAARTHYRCHMTITKTMALRKCKSLDCSNVFLRFTRSVSALFSYLISHWLWYVDGVMFQKKDVSAVFVNCFMVLRFKTNISLPPNFYFFLYYHSSSKCQCFLTILPQTISSYTTTAHWSNYVKYRNVAKIHFG